MCAPSSASYFSSLGLEAQAELSSEVLLMPYNPSLFIFRTLNIGIDNQNKKSISF